MTTYPVTLTQNLTAHLSTGGITAATIQTQNLSAHDVALPGLHWHNLNTDGVIIHETPPAYIFSFVKALSQNLTIHPSDTEAWKWGRTLTQALTAHQADVEHLTYHGALTNTFKIAQVLQRAFPVVYSQALTAHQASTLAIALTTLQRLNLIPTQAPHATFHLTVAQALLMNSALARFFGIVLTQNLTTHPTQAVLYLSSPVLTQNLTVHQGGALTISVTHTGNLQLTPAQVVKMIYAGDPLLDTLVLNALYLSPSGTATTWAINTRTNAITQYTNYNFNSFAAMGLNYIAANANGIYELDGDTDAGTAIISEIQSGLMRLNGSKLAGLKGVYLAMRGGGQIFLKIISGDSREYIYQANLQPAMTTTKVNIGKGLRTTYISFDLQTTGQDFDLDSLEFVPMLSDRRV